MPGAAQNLVLLPAGRGSGCQSCFLAVIPALGFPSCLCEAALSPRAVPRDPSYSPGSKGGWLTPGSGVRGEIKLLLISSELGPSGSGLALRAPCRFLSHLLCFPPEFSLPLTSGG